MNLEVSRMTDAVREVLDDNNISYVEGESGVSVELPTGTVVKNDVEDDHSRPAEWYYHIGTQETLVVDADEGTLGVR